MRWIISVLLTFSAFAFFPKSAHAIVFLPALILIPVAKIVALMIAGFAFPALGVGVLWSKLFGKSVGKTILVIITILLILSVALAVFLKIQNPDRPLF